MRLFEKWKTSQNTAGGKTGQTGEAGEVGTTEKQVQPVRQGKTEQPGQC